MATHVEVRNPLRQVKKRVPSPLKAAGRSVLRDYGRATAHWRPLPDFLVIGAKRGGTTSLWNYLVRHPQVVPMFPAVQQIKSPHYFDINYHRGEQWYRSHFPTHARRRAAQLRHGGATVVTGEASPYYMFHPLAAERAQHLVPRAKVIVSLRNPVDRAYSNYNERVGSGAEELATFEEALDAEPRRLAGEAERIVADPHYYSLSHDSHSYLARGRYLEHLTSWLDRFPQDQVLVLFADDLSRNPHQYFVEVCAFLGLAAVDLRQYDRHNHLPVAPMAAATRERLVDYYRPHNAALAARLGVDLDWDK